MEAPEVDGQNELALTTTLSPAEEELLEEVAASTSYPHFILAILIVLFFFTFVLNVAVGHALYQARRLKPSLRVLLFNLSISDAAIVNFYHLIYSWISNRFTIECVIRYGLVTEMMTVTLFFIVVLSLDRVVALAAALRYDQLVTERRLWALSAFVWVFGMLYPLAAMIGVDLNSEHCVYQLFMPRYSFLFYGTGSLAIIAFIAGLTAFTFRKTLSHIERIAVTMVMEVAPAAGSGGNDDEGERRSRRKKAARVAAMNRKAAVTSLFVTVPFVLLCSPIYILFFVFYFLPGLTETILGLVLITVCLGLVVTNSLVNPFIYVWRSAEVREEMKRSVCLRRLFARRDSSSSVSTVGTSRQRI